MLLCSKSPLSGRRVQSVVAVCVLVLGMTPQETHAEGTAPVLNISGNCLITLPIGDGLNDEADLTITSSVAGSVSLSLVLSSSGSTVETLATDAPLSPDGAQFSATVAVAPTATTGSYIVRATQTSGGVPTTFDSQCVIGSGNIKRLSISPSTTTIYPYPDGVGDSFSIDVVGYDETSTTLPISGTLAILQGTRQYVQRAFQLSMAPQMTLSTAGFPYGLLTAKVVATGPGGSAKTSALYFSSAANTLRSISMSKDIPTVYPVVDGYKDVVTVRLNASTSSGGPVRGVGFVSVTFGSKVVKKWPISSAGNTSLRWDGKTSGTVVPGTYKISASFVGAEGGKAMTSGYVTVSKKRLVSKTARATYSLYTAVDTCSLGDSFDPCSELRDFSPSIYGSGFGDFTAIGLSLPFRRSDLKSWRLIFNNVEEWSGSRWAFFTCLDSSWQTCGSSSGGLQGWFPTFQFNGINLATSWTSSGLGSLASAYFWIGSEDWGRLYIDSITIEGKYLALE